MFVEIKPSQRDVEGVWVTYSEGVKFRIARAGNPAFLKSTDRLEAPHRKKISRGKLSTEKTIELHCAAMAEGILLDWEGLATNEGPLPYSKETATAVLRYNTDVRDFVFEFATDQENFRQDEVVATAKKSAAT